MEDVVRWVDIQEETEVLELLSAAGVDEALHAARVRVRKGSTAAELDLHHGRDRSRALRRWPAGNGGRRWPVDPVRLIHGSNTLYLCAPAHDQRRLRPLFVSVIRQIVECAYDRVAGTRRPLDPPLLIVLDEAANIAPISDLDGLAATAAGHGVQLVTIWHDLAQITARYGHRATTVVNNHRAKLFLSGISDPSTLDYASHLIGEQEVHLPAVTHGGAMLRAPPTHRLCASWRPRRAAAHRSRRRGPRLRRPPPGPAAPRGAGFPTGGLGRLSDSRAGSGEDRPV